MSVENDGVLPPPPGRIAELLRRVREGERTALARALSVVEDEREGFQPLLHELLSPGLPGGMRVGVTGPPGVGKSSLVSRMVKTFRERDEEVGVLAVDPTSPFSGGALLGDRIRMGELATDPGVFIRSMASRGSLGGLATTTKEVLDIMDAFGFPNLIVETVGVGQAEVEITEATDTVVVVLMPEQGDAIQAMKAGLMEIADIFVVNKADRPGADRLVKEIRSAIDLATGRGPRASRPTGHHGVLADSAKARGEAAENGTGPEEEGWTPPVLLTTAHRGEGIEELLDAVAEHRDHMMASGELEERRKARTLTRVRDVMERELRRRVRRLLAREELGNEVVGRVTGGAATSYSEAHRLLTELLDRGSEGRA